METTINILISLLATLPLYGVAYLSFKTHYLRRQVNKVDDAINRLDDAIKGVNSKPQPMSEDQFREALIGCVAFWLFVLLLLGS